jgi:hypothetical protein
VWSEESLVARANRGPEKGATLESSERIEAKRTKLRMEKPLGVARYSVP